MKRYYYLAASLGALELEEKPSISFNDFLEEASVYLSKEHMRQVSILRELIDIENIRKLLLEMNLDDRGNFSEKALDEAVLGRVDLPDYAIDFLTEFSTTASRLEHFAALYAGFFRAYADIAQGFLKDYLSFEREVRLWISLLRAQRLGIDFNQVLQFEEASDPLIMSMLVQGASQDLRLPPEYQKLKEIYLSYADTPLMLHKNLEKFRLNKIKELTQDKLFKIDVILGFLASLLIVEHFAALNAQEGLKRLNRFTTKE